MGSLCPCQGTADTAYCAKQSLSGLPLLEGFGPQDEWNNDMVTQEGGCWPAEPLPALLLASLVPAGSSGLPSGRFQMKKHIAADHKAASHPRHLQLIISSLGYTVPSHHCCDSKAAERINGVWNSAIIDVRKIADFKTK